jgi:hypothetical protein
VHELLKTSTATSRLCLPAVQFLTNWLVKYRLSLPGRNRPPPGHTEMSRPQALAFLPNPLKTSPPKLSASLQINSRIPLCWFHKRSTRPSTRWTADHRPLVSVF